MAAESPGARVRLARNRMRLGGFEPPTHGLEGRRSSAELQAPTGEGSAAKGRRYLTQRPKSAVTTVTGLPLNSPPAEPTCRAPRPISRHVRESRFPR